jgi:hypothetical protein
MLKCYRCKKHIDDKGVATVNFQLNETSIGDFEIVHIECINSGLRYPKLGEWLHYWDLIRYLFFIMSFTEHGKRLDLRRLARVVEDLVNEINRLERLEKKKPKVPRDPKEEKEINKLIKAIFGNSATKFRIPRCYK